VGTQSRGDASKFSVAVVLSASDNQNAFFAVISAVLAKWATLVFPYFAISQKMLPAMHVLENSQKCDLQTILAYKTRGFTILMRRPAPMPPPPSTAPCSAAISPIRSPLDSTNT
jgi:hypothetical protein